MFCQVSFGPGDGSLISFDTGATGYPGDGSLDYPEVENMYADASDVLILKAGSHDIHLAKSGWRDWVLWNIGQEKAPAMRDLGEGEYKNYVENNFRSLNACTVAFTIFIKNSKCCSLRSRNFQF